MDNVDKFKEIAKGLGELYEKKNRAYGNSFSDTYKKLGIISAVTRISDKHNRLCNLATNPDIDNLGESIEDTLKDLASYAIMTLIELDSARDITFKGKPQPHNKDTFHPSCRRVPRQIKIGDKFVCYQDVIDNEGQIPYKKGKNYESEIDNCLTNEMGDKHYNWENRSYFDDYFLPLAK